MTEYRIVTADGDSLGTWEASDILDALRQAGTDAGMPLYPTPLSVVVVGSPQDVLPCGQCGEPREVDDEGNCDECRYDHSRAKEDARNGLDRCCCEGPKGHDGTCCPRWFVFSTCRGFELGVCDDCAPWVYDLDVVEFVPLQKRLKGARETLTEAGAHGYTAALLVACGWSWDGGAGLEWAHGKESKRDA